MDGWTFRPFRIKGGFITIWLLCTTMLLLGTGYSLLLLQGTAKTGDVHYISPGFLHVPYCC